MLPLYESLIFIKAVIISAFFILSFPGCVQLFPISLTFLSSSDPYIVMFVKSPFVANIQIISMYAIRSQHYVTFCSFQIINYYREISNII